MQQKLTKSLFALFLLIMIGLPGKSQNVSISDNGTDPDNSALLDIKFTGSNVKGLLIPRMTTAQRSANWSSTYGYAQATGLLVYDTDEKAYFYWDGTAWKEMFSAGSGWSLDGNTGVTASNFLGTINSADLNFRTTNTERMSIEANGDVIMDGTTFFLDESAARIGIGTTSPDGKLEVRQSAAADILNLYDDATNVLTVIDGGKVGIGTSAPNSLLEISSDAGLTMGLQALRLVHNKWWDGQTLDIGLYSSLAEEGRIRSKICNAGATITSLSLWTKTAGTLSETMTLYDNKVGIGTSTPTSALEVNGQVKITGGSPGTGKVLTSDASGLASWQTSSGGSSMVFSTNMSYSCDDRSGWTAGLSGDDNYGGPYNIGFTLNINGTGYTQWYMATNGLIGFGASLGGSLISNYALPYASYNYPMLAWFWDDYYVTSSEYVTLGTAGNRICYIYIYGYVYGYGSYPMEVMVSLHEGSNLIEVVYEDIDPVSACRGSAATFGFQVSGSEGYPVGYNVEVLDDNANRQFMSFRKP